MSADSVDYILKQTELTTVFAAKEYIDKLLTMIKEGLAMNIRNLVSFDEVNES